MPVGRNRRDLRGWEWYYLRTLCEPGQSPQRELSGHTSWIGSLAWDATGQNLASAGADAIIRLWDSSTGKLMHEFPGHSGEVLGLAWNPKSGTLVSVGKDCRVKLWSVSSGVETTTIEEGQHAYCKVGWSVDGRYLAAGSEDGNVAIWNSSGKNVGEYYRRGPIWEMTWSGRENRLAIGSYRGQELEFSFWEPNSKITEGVLSETLPRISANEQMAISPDGRWLAWPMSDRMVPIHSIDGRVLKIVTVLSGHSKQIRSVVWSPDGRRIATASDDGTVKIWAAENRADASRIHAWEIYGQDVPDTVVTFPHELLTLRGHEGSVLALAWSPTGRRLAAAGSDGTIRIWDATVGYLVAGKGLSGE